jgi:cytohesin
LNGRFISACNKLLLDVYYIVLLWICFVAGGRYKSWKRRWFILNDNCLYYFQFTTDKEPKGIIPLEDVQVREVPDRGKPNCFELYSQTNDVIKACKTDSEGKVIEGKHNVYRLSASTAEEKDEWIACLTRKDRH